MFTIILLIVVFLGGMKVQKCFSPKFSFTDNHLYMEYKGEKGVRKTKKVF